ncbi:MAG TPA: hypothetical protein VIG06_13445 [Kofleriaceae bacterium]
MRPAAALVLLLAAACSEESPAGKTVPLSQSDEGKDLRDQGSATAKEKAVAKAKAAAAVDQVAAAEPEPQPGGEIELEADKVWLTVPGTGVDVGVAPEVRIARTAGGEVVLTDGKDELRVRRAGAGDWDKEAILERLSKEAGGKVGVVVDRADGTDVRLEYVAKDKKSGAPMFGLVMRRVIDGHTVECASRGARTNSTFMALEACRRMRATAP